MTHFRYKAFLAPPGDTVDGEYETTRVYWHVLAARLSFVIVFEVRICKKHQEHLIYLYIFGVSAE